MNPPQASHERVPRAAQAGAVLETLLGCSSWEPFKGPTGMVLWRVPGADGETYTVCRISCTCPYDRYARGAPCKHRAALHLYLLVAGVIRRRREPTPPKDTSHAVV